MKIKLKPCPFCGEPVEGLYDSRNEYVIYCDGCKMYVGNFDMDSVVRVFNTRKDVLTFTRLLLLIAEISVKALALAICLGIIYNIYNNIIS